jgi:hypothetical protein
MGPVRVKMALSRARVAVGVAAAMLVGGALAGCASPGGQARAAGRNAAATLAGARLSAGRGMAVMTKERGSGHKKAKPDKHLVLAPVKGPILEVGDSLGIDLGWGLQAKLAGSGHEFLGEAVGDTGLAEPWYYDWPVHLQAYLAEYHPGLLIVFLGANDVENLYVGGVYDPFGSRGWVAAYGQRVAEMMAEATAAGARVLWVGMPPMGDPSFSSDMATLNALYLANANRHKPDVAFFPSWTVLGTAHGQFEQGPPGPDGQDNPWRAPDGVHITPQGADVLASAVVTNLRQRGWLAKG